MLLTPMTESTPMRSEMQRSGMTRRGLLAGVAAAALVGAAADPALALNTGQAKAMVDKLVAELNVMINSGKTASQLRGRFEQFFVTWADVPTIARSILGPDARSASAAQMRAYTAAFQGYMARKYGKRYLEFQGGEIVVQRAEKWKSHYQVHTTVKMRGRAPFSVIFRVSDRSGREKIFDMIIEGISLLKSEAVEVRALLDRNGGSIDKLTQALGKMG